MGVHPYHQVVGVHGQHYLSLHCHVHVVDHDVEQQGGDHRSLRNAHTLTPLMVDVAPFNLTCINLSLGKDLM